MTTRLFPSLAVVFFVACASGGSDATPDLGGSDAAVGGDMTTPVDAAGDASSMDATVSDAGDMAVADAPASDAPATDGAVADAATTDSGSSDSGLLTDLGASDAAFECLDSLACDDDNVCTLDVCNASHVCENGPVVTHTACDDGLACTTTDSCSGGACIGSHYVLCPSGCECVEPGGVCGGVSCKI